MSLSDYKHGSNTQTDHNYSLHSLPMAENDAKRPVRKFFDFRHTKMPENLDVKSLPLLSLNNLRSISKVKVVSYLMGLMLTLLIMASYILARDKKGQMFTLSPNQLRPVVVPASTAAADVSPENNLIDMKFISSKLEYKPRKVPDKKDVIETNSHLFSVIPRHFLPGIKNPCWYEEFSGELSTDPYRRSNYIMRLKTVHNHLRTNFHQHLYRRDGKLFRLRCLPFFYVIGQPKCGTTDLFNKLKLHPEIKLLRVKEPHWWTRKRFGHQKMDGYINQGGFPVEDYLDLFDLAAQNIQELISRNSSGAHRTLQLITGEASASTMWDNIACSHRSDTEPPFLAQDFIHTVHPGAKIIIMLRDPVERLYSDYLYFRTNKKSAEDFHQKVVESVQLFQSCLSEMSLRFCTYNPGKMTVRLTLGMYVVFLQDWLTVFQREQILVIQLEDYSANFKVSIKKIFDFLTVGPLSEKVEAALTKRSKSNSRQKADKNLGPMLPTTRALLREFYQAFNRKLASVLDSKAFLWSTT